MKPTDSANPQTLPPGNPTLRVIPMPKDSNASGDVFGGWMMAQVDLAGSVVAVGHAQGRVVTVAVNELVFVAPVLVGDLCSFFASIVHVGKSSMRVAIDVYANRRLHPEHIDQVCHATLTYVAVDEDRKPRQVRPL